MMRTGHSQYAPGWLWVAYGLCACSGLTESGSPPVLDPIGNHTVLVGEKLSIVVTGTDADGDALTFRIKDRPASAQYMAMADGESALFTWTPEVTDSAPGGMPHEIEFILEDETGAWDSETVTITVVPQWAPAFLNPPGYVLDLAKSEALEFMVQVKDDSVAHVGITIAQGPAGAYLEQTDKKKAYFSWKPTAAQIHEKLFWYVRFQAQGYLSDPARPGQEIMLYTITHDVVIVLINANQGGCPGSAPLVTHSPPGDLHWTGGGPQAGGYPVSATVVDADSYVAQVNLFWTKLDPSSEANFTLLPMTSAGGDAWFAAVPKTIAGPGTVLHYYIEAWDGDDYSGSTCDHVTRLPKQGAIPYVVYDPGFEQSCLEDDSEPNDSQAAATMLEQPVPVLDRRLCPGGTDYFAFYVFTSQADVAVLPYGPAADDLEMAPLSAAGSPVGNAVKGEGAVSVPQAALPGNLLALRFTNLGDEAVTYSFLPAVTPDTCTPDELEPNDSHAAASFLGEGEFQKLSICAGDSDWFRLEIPQGTFLSVLLDFSVDAGDLDLYLLAADGESIVSSAQTGGDDEVLELNVPAGGTYYLLVNGFAGSTNSYNLTITYAAQSEVCQEDNFAPNQVPLQAVSVLPVSYDGLVSCPGKEDWFLIGLNGTETVTITAQSAAAGLTLDLVDFASLLPVCSAYPAGTQTTLACSVSAPGDYLFEVTNASAVAAPYSLAVKITDTSPGCVEDRFEENDAPAQATQVSKSVLTWLKACGSDPDWFQAYGFTYEVLFAALMYPDGLGPVDLALYAEDGFTQLAGSMVDQDLRYVEVPLAQTGTYLIKVWATDGYGGPYSLVVMFE